MSVPVQKSSPSFFSKLFSGLFLTPQQPANTLPTLPLTPVKKIPNKKSDARRDYTKAIFQALPDLIFVFDRKGNFVDYKPAHFGGPRAPAEQFIGKNIAEVLPMHITFASITAMQHAFEHGGVRVIEYEGMVRGKEHVFEGRYVAMNKKEALAVIRDVTDRKEVEERLSKRNFEMKTLVDNLLIGVVLEDEARTITQVNDELFNMFDLSIKPSSSSKDTLPSLGTHYTNGMELTKRIALLCKNQDSFIARINEIAHRLEKITNEEIVLQDGRIIELEYMPICREGVCLGHLWMYRDVTEHKRIDQMKSEFVSIASHQLRTPLTGIKWISSLLLKEKTGSLNSNQRELLNDLVESNERMIILVNDLLSISRIESGKMSLLELKNEDLVAYTRSVIDELAPVAAKKQIRLKMSSSLQQIVVSVDAKKLRQVLINIIGNAIKYSSNSSAVTIHLRVEKTEVIFSCQDSGIGVPLVDQDRLFEKFFRAPNAVKFQIEGSGLGLYIAKALVEAQQGKLWFESEEGKGSTFFVSLPFKKPTKT